MQARVSAWDGPRSVRARPSSLIGRDLSDSQADRPDFPRACFVLDDTANHGYW